MASTRETQFRGTPGVHSDVCMSEAEATKLVREAEQAEAKKNVFFQPRPDWEKAADCYQKAALILRSPALKKTDAAVCAFDKASVAHAKCGAKFFAGVALENAANVLRDARCLSAAAAKYAQASEMFLLGDNIEKGSEVLIKAAKVSAEEQPDFAIQYYLDVIAIFEESDKHVYISDTWRSALGLMLRRGRLEDAAKLLQRMCPTFARLEQADYLYKAQLRCQSCVLTAHLSVLPPANYPRACPLCKVDATPPSVPLLVSSWCIWRERTSVQRKRHWTNSRAWWILLRGVRRWSWLTNSRWCLVRVPVPVRVCACAPATMCVRSRARVQGVPVAASASRGGFARSLSAGW